MFGWFKKKPQAPTPETDTVTVYLNPLVMLLSAAEERKGTPLSEAEVLEIRDTAASVQMTPEQARIFHASLDAQMPMHRIDPDRIWDEWQQVRHLVE